MAYPSLLDLRNDVIDHLNDYSVVLYPDAMIDRALNDAQLDIAAKALCLEDVLTFYTAASTRTVEVSDKAIVTDSGVSLITDDGKVLVTDNSSEVVKVLGVEYVSATGVRTGLLPITPMQIGHVPSRTGEPEFFFRWGRTIGIEPKPSTTTYHLEVYVAYSPKVLMDQPTSVPELPLTMVPYMLDYATVRCLIRTRKFATAIDIWNGYNQDLMKMRKRVYEKWANRAEDVMVPDRTVMG